MLIISDDVAKKLRQKHDVDPREVHECFLRIVDEDAPFVLEDHPSHRTWPPTFWFIGTTFAGRELKIVFIEDDDGTTTLKTAHEPSTRDRITYHARYPES